MSTHRAKTKSVTGTKLKELVNEVSHILISVPRRDGSVALLEVAPSEIAEEIDNYCGLVGDASWNIDIQKTDEDVLVLTADQNDADTGAGTQPSKPTTVGEIRRELLTATNVLVPVQKRDKTTASMDVSVTEMLGHLDSYKDDDPAPWDIDPESTGDGQLALDVPTS